MPDTEPTRPVMYHSNNGLFADYYLNEIMPRLPEWSDSLFEAGKACLGQIKALRRTLHPENLDEAQLEENWVQPVLHLLGQHYAVQGKIRYRENGHRKPDYVFLSSAAEAQAVTSQVYEPDEIRHWLAVGDAKRWGVNLDQSAGNGQRSPSQQIDEYLRYSERPWGILTDGRVWRLYQRESSKYNRYYAVDLETLLENENVDAFLYFYAFFRREAFTGGWLERVLAGSEDFAQKLTDTLEGEVFEALELIAQGFLDYRRNRLKADPATLRQIYEQSLVLLYRLLFIFYAESREILPLNQNDEYTAFRSLQSTKREAALALNFNKPLNQDSTAIYARLNDLFFAIDAGDEQFDLPPYNGRLFSETEHPFLAKNAVGDACMIPALDKLARVDDNGKRVFVDYRDLEVRHLGSIYEKLLEYDLAIAAEALTTRGAEERYAPAGAGDKIVKQKGQVYLKTGSNERKVTGSYYTPDYIVRFIVEKTLEPLLTAITARHADLNEDGSWTVRDSEAAGLVNEVLALNLLDPATGSGHFVVDATAYMAEWLRGLGIRPADLGSEDELIYWKRQVASACIYAVDINPLAVELAKLSMWLATLAKGKPLSFLDHHIRAGNSLVGTRMSAINDAALSVQEEERQRRARQRAREREASSGQAAMFSDADFNAGVQFAVQQMDAIEHTIANRVSDVKHQEELYAELTQRLSGWKQAADVWTARYFGLEVPEEEWGYIRDFSKTGVLPPFVRVVTKQAEALATTHRFFHWELAFPEIFYDADGKPKANPGFDAVVGNPPYVRQERLQPIKPFLETHYEVYSGTADLFLYFYEQGIRFLKPEHRLGYISAGTYTNTRSAKEFREYIQGNASFDTMIDFGAVQPFRGVDVATNVAISILKNDRKLTPFRATLIEGRKPPTSLSDDLNKNGFDCDPISLSTDTWRFQPLELTRLLSKILATSQNIHDFIGGSIYYGIKTGLNEAFIINDEVRQQLTAENPQNAEIIKPMRRGQDLRPWYQIESKEYLIWTYQGIKIDEYPLIKAHLSKFQAGLANRSDARDIEWFELRPCDYYDEFEKPKIVWPNISKFPRLSRDNTGLYVIDTVAMIVSDSNSLLGVLSSRLAWFVMSQIASPLAIREGLWRYQPKIQFVERLPIPTLTTEQEASLAALAEEITGLAQGRYKLHEAMRRTMRNEFGGGEISTRVDLYRWWELADESALSDQIRRQLGQEIPLKKRAEWRGFLEEQKTEHGRLTGQIVALETRLNGIVYDAFDLTADERGLIERTTQYRYGEV